jgi:hypothetical protein
MDRKSGLLALDYIFRPCTDDGEGFLHLWLGNTRMGKTYANNVVINEVLKRKHTDVIFTVDDKNPSKPQYDGTQRANPDHLLRSPLRPDENNKHINFRGVSYRSDLADHVHHGDVATLVWNLKRTNPPLRLCLNIDELGDATNGKQSWLDDANAQIYRKGAGVGISTTATTQMPQIVPREAFGLSQTIGIFRLDAREIDYLVRYRLVTPDVVGLMAGLERGDFLMYVRGSGLLPDVYRF